MSAVLESPPRRKKLVLAVDSLQVLDPVRGRIYAGGSQNLECTLTCDTFAVCTGNTCCDCSPPSDPQTCTICDCGCV